MGSSRIFFRGSLRTKLAVALGAAALFPLLLVSALGIRVAFGRLERGLTVQARQTAHIALNLLLRQVERISRETVRLAIDPELPELLTLEPSLIERYLETYYTMTESSLVEVVLKDRRVVARFSPNNEVRFKNLHSSPESPVLIKALNYERSLTLVATREGIVIQAAAPIVDAMFELRGAVVITSPLDEQMADTIKGVVQAEIGFYRGIVPVASTYVDEAGQSIAGLAPPSTIVPDVLAGNTMDGVQEIGGHLYAIAFAPLQTVQGDRIGMISAGFSREGFIRAQLSAAKPVLIGAATSLILALLLAFIVGKRITTPLEHLHHGTQAIAAGNLDQPLVAESEDEIGDLARAFQQMTVALRENQERLAARMREISTLHKIGRAVSSVLSLDQVLQLVVDQVADVLGAERGALLFIEEKGRLQLRANLGLGQGNDSPLPAGWMEMAEEVVRKHAAQVSSTILAVSLETRERVMGALVIARRDGAVVFSEGELSLVVTFADQAATAIENARLYEKARAFSQELEAEVEKRTAELAEANQRLAQLAITDGLTGLYNHRYFQERLANEVERSNRTLLPLSLLMIDVDHFKRYNDVNGHPAGDTLLRELAQILTEGRRLNDAVARYGGEEFAILLVDTPGQGAALLAEQLRHRVEEREFAHRASQPGGRLTISLGMATCPDDAKHPADLITIADKALYRAKNRGRNRVELAEEKKKGDSS
jgi:two-component system, cell cycle response regulator